MSTKSLYLLVFCACATVFSILTLVYPDETRDYRRYLFEDYPDLTLDYTKLSQDWRESDLNAQFPGYHFFCQDNEPGRIVGERSCYVDVKHVNGVSAMYVAFHFKRGLLNSVSVNIPWWKHAEAYKYLIKTFGEPYSQQFLPRLDQRLMGWELADHSSLLFNRDYPLNPLDFNSIGWESARSCGEQGCFIQHTASEAKAEDAAEVAEFVFKKVLKIQ